MAKKKEEGRKEATEDQEPESTQEIYEKQTGSNED